MKQSLSMKSCSSQNENPLPQWEKLDSNLLQSKTTPTHSVVSKCVILNEGKTKQSTQNVNIVYS